MSTSIDGKQDTKENKDERDKSNKPSNLIDT